MQIDTDPHEWAERIDPGEEDGIGVRRDTLVEARIEAENVAHQLRSAAVAIDAAADTQGLVPDEMGSDLAYMYSDLGDMAQWFERLSAKLATLEDEAKFKASEREVEDGGE